MHGICLIRLPEKDCAAGIREALWFVCSLGWGGTFQGDERWVLALWDANEISGLIFRCNTLMEGSFAFVSCSGS